MSNVHSPSITPYLPSADTSTGVAVIIAPGGGHRELWMDHEGYNPANWLSDHGIAAFVLKYRLAREEDSTYTIEDHALADMRRSIRLVSNRADEWGIDPDKIGAMGFLAGGELVVFAGMESGAGDRSSSDPIERQSAKLAFQALIYPGRSDLIMPTADSPAAFLVCGFQDRPDISIGMAEAYLRFKEVDVPAELHIYSDAGHGFGMREWNQHLPSGRWPDRFQEWLADRGLLE